MFSEAQNLGEEAFLAGKCATPAADSNIIELIRTKGNGDSTLTMLEDWVRGWHAANLNADVGEK